MHLHCLNQILPTLAIHQILLLDFLKDLPLFNKFVYCLLYIHDTCPCSPSFLVWCPSLLLYILFKDSLESTWRHSNSNLGDLVDLWPSFWNHLPFQPHLLLIIWRRLPKQKLLFSLLMLRSQPWSDLEKQLRYWRLHCLVLHRRRRWPYRLLMNDNW